MQGHLDTEGLDPTTARSLEVLAAADVIAAEAKPKHLHKPLWKQGSWLMAVTILLTLVLVAWGQLRFSQQADEMARQGRRLIHVQHQNQKLIKTIRSCVTPKGECAKRGAASQAVAIGQIIDAVGTVVCTAIYPDDSQAVARCVVDVRSALEQGH